MNTPPVIFPRVYVDPGAILPTVKLLLTAPLEFILNKIISRPSIFMIFVPVVARDDVPSKNIPRALSPFKSIIIPLSETSLSFAYNATLFLPTVILDPESTIVPLFTYTPTAFSEFFTSIVPVERSISASEAIPPVLLLSAYIPIAPVPADALITPVFAISISPPPCAGTLAGF